ncbi:hypothetical protein [Bradyrhizobium sp. dw_78]|uniref:hypothetical protein n=1 Tax=Bradyrhizobium sp. dw_78 TaxID=2719793 RepID=UPI001BD5E182|nr:hypothetical protein [Bradyrhizobium sp. dw_78]
MMVYSEDHIALAAEYVLGTLDADERVQVETMMSVDKDFMAMVQAWEQRLGALNQMAGLVEPRPEVWDRIKAAVGHSQAQAPLVLPQALREPAAPDIERPVLVADTANVIRLSARVRRWRSVALIATAIAAMLAAVLVTGIDRPDLLPAVLRQRPQAAEVGAPPAQ